MDQMHNKVSVWFDEALSILIRRRKQAIIGLVGAVFLVFGVIGYSYYREWAQMSAHQAFIDSLRYYEAPAGKTKTVITESTIEFGSEEEKWKRIEEIFRRGYEKYRGAGIGPMFGAYQADALAQLGKKDEAIEVLSGVIKNIPSRELKDFYRLKVALLKLDNLAQDKQQSGLAELKQIAEDSKNYAHEAGLYYMGFYYWTAKNFDAARNYWQQLMIKYGNNKDVKYQSGYADLVKPKLKLISAEW